ncbi:hypothetical protein U9M48_002273 [Paspalum notatum var. saurae]|uniref:RING-type E3 ubiquitin transferase n=1 Tax=Paspalum notatum var. saurae TaxID=547442 RepID=A0AAQ3PJ82_PASNO
MPATSGATARRDLRRVFPGWRGAPASCDLRRGGPAQRLGRACDLRPGFPARPPARRVPLPAHRPRPPEPHVATARRCARLRHPNSIRIQEKAQCALDHTEVAVKVFQQDSIDKTDDFLKEVDILSQICHPNLVLLLGSVQKLAIIFEVSSGLAFLHARNPEPIVHRDLKPANILLDRNYVGKIGNLLTGQHPNGLIVTAENALKNDRLSDILNKSQTDWPLDEAEMFARLGLKCTALRCRDRLDLESEVLPKLDEIPHRITSAVYLRNPKLSVPSQFICPITQELMEDPHVAADGHTYEHYTIRAWLKRHKISPVMRNKLLNPSIILNLSLCAAIQQWKSHLPAQTSA